MVPAQLAIVFSTGQTVDVERNWQIWMEMDKWVRYNIVSLCANRGFTSEDVDDCLSQTMILFVEHNSCDGGIPCRKYALILARRVISDQYKLTKPEIIGLDVAGVAGKLVMTPPADPGVEINTQHPNSELFTLFLAGYTQKEIAARKGVHRNTVRNRLRRQSPHYGRRSVEVSW